MGGFYQRTLTWFSWMHHITVDLNALNSRVVENLYAEANNKSVPSSVSAVWSIYFRSTRNVMCFTGITSDLQLWNILVWPGRSNARGGVKTKCSQLSLAWSNTGATFAIRYFQQDTLRTNVMIEIYTDRWRRLFKKHSVRRRLFDMKMILFFLSRFDSNLAVHRGNWKEIRKW